MVYNLASAFREFDRSHDGRVSVQELKKEIASSLSRTISEEQTSKIMQSLDLGQDESSQEDDFRGVEELRRRLDKIIQDEKDAAFMAKRSSVAAKLAAQKAEAIADQQSPPICCGSPGGKSALLAASAGCTSLRPHFVGEHWPSLQPYIRPTPLLTICLPRHPSDWCNCILCPGCHLEQPPH